MDHSANTLEESNFLDYQTQPPLPTSPFSSASPPPPPPPPPPTPSTEEEVLNVPTTSTSPTSNTEIQWEINNEMNELTSPEIMAEIESYKSSLKQPYSLPLLLLPMHMTLFNKEIIFGYDSKDFQACFAFVNEKRRCVVMRVAEFIEFCANPIVSNSAANQEAISNPKSIGTKIYVFQCNHNASGARGAGILRMRMTTKRHDRVLVLENMSSNIKVNLGYKDLELFRHLMPTLKHSANVMNSLEADVQRYFSYYVSQCHESNVSELQTFNFAFPPNAINGIDYYRLFLEIRYFLSEEVLKALTLKQFDFSSM